MSFCFYSSFFSRFCLFLLAGSNTPQSRAFASMSLLAKIKGKASSAAAASPPSPLKPMHVLSVEGLASPKTARKVEAHKLEAQIPQSQPNKPQPRQKLSLADIQVMQTVGTGSFGRVHLVKYKPTGKFHAMKVLKKAEIVRMKQVEHIINEKQILEQLGHPFLLSMLGTFQDWVYLYMVMEYVSGGELFSYLRKSGVRLKFHTMMTLPKFDPQIKSVPPRGLPIMLRAFTRAK